MTSVSNLDNLAAAIATSSPKIRNYAIAQAAATQSQELDIQAALSGGGSVFAHFPVVYVTTDGDDANNGRSPLNAKATVEAAVDALAGNGIVQCGIGTFPVLAEIMLRQAVWIVGTGNWYSTQGTILQWEGADDTGFMVRTANDTAGSDFSGGRLSNLTLQCGPTKPGGGAYALKSGLNCRNVQNGSHFYNLLVKDFPGTGVKAGTENNPSPPDGFPGFTTWERVWSSGNGVLWHLEGGYTSDTLLMCGGDISSRTTDVMIIDPPADDPLGNVGKFGLWTLIGFKSEDNGSPTAPGADANYITMNSEAQLALIGCAFFNGVPGTKPLINLTREPSSVNAATDSYPVTMTNVSTQNIPVAFDPPAGSGLPPLAPAEWHGGEVFQIAHYVAQP